MGARGANIQKVCSDFNVQIKIPDRKPNKPQQNGGGSENGEANESIDVNVIRISGKKENCDEASAALQALVPINIEVRLMWLFRYLFGSGVPPCLNLFNNIAKLTWFPEI